MSISCEIDFRILPEDDFYRVDFQVMKHVFACHNELGRLCDESIYQSDVAARLVTAGFGPVQTEVPLIVTWRDFRKTYYLDLVVSNSHLYELKAARTLVGEHKSQTLNYILMLDVPRAKILNLRPTRVETWFASTTLTQQVRCCVESDFSRWQPLTSSCDVLRAAVLEIMAEFGAFLKLELYEEMLIWALGGESQIVQRIELLRNDSVLGTQRFALLSPDIGFFLTALRKTAINAESNLHRLLRHTRMRAIQWVNINRTTIEFVTISRP